MPAIEEDWFIREWLASSGTSQAELDRRTGWGKRKASFLVNGQQPFNRATLNEAAAALNIRVYELLMHPDDAMALRQLRRDALQVVETSKALDKTEGRTRTGTRG